MKIVYIGAGSFRFSFQLFRNFAALAKIFTDVEVWLVDINKSLLQIMTQVLRRITKKSKVTNNFKVFSTTQRSQALEHADIVIVSISVGQQRSEWFDIHIPLKFGIPQTVGDTCGPGGVFRALCVVPIFNEIVRDVAELCPKATIFNYTNPIAPLVLGANQTCSHVETIGICHELLGGMPVLLNFLKKLGRKNIQKWEGLDIKYSGINHFSWLLEINFQREDLYPLIRENNMIIFPILEDDTL